MFSKNFPYLRSFNTLHDPIKQVLLFSQIFRWGTEKLNNLSEVTQLLNGRTGIQTQAVFLHNQWLTHFAELAIKVIFLKTTLISSCKEKCKAIWQQVLKRKLV